MPGIVHAVTRHTEGHIQLELVGMESASYVRVQENHRYLHLAALYLNFL